MVVGVVYMEALLLWIHCTQTGGGWQNVCMLGACDDMVLIVNICNNYTHPYHIRMGILELH